MGQRYKLHRDGTMFEETPVKFFAPTYDGHKPEDISRLISL